jgi:capsular exopolysaccharide synthesis family protein
VLANLPDVAGAVAPGGGGAVFDEAIRSLRTNVKFLTGQRASSILLVVSAAPGAGSTLVATHLAVALSAAGEGTLLIDGNLRRPGIERQLGIDGGSGLSLLLAGEPGISPVATPWPNLHVMGPGPLPPNPAELLNSHCLPEWLSQARVSYPMIVMDASDLVSTSDALVLAEHADVLLLVARDMKTTATDLATVMARISPVQGKLSGTVLTGNRAFR